MSLNSMNYIVSNKQVSLNCKNVPIWTQNNQKEVDYFF